MSAETVVKSLAGCTSLIMLLSPSIAMYRVCKTGDLGLLSIVPLASLLANAHVWMMYGYLSDLIFPIFVTFVTGDVLAVIYLSIYWRFTTERAKVRRVLLFTLAVLFVLSLYGILGGLGCFGQSSHDVGTTMGVIADVVSVCLYGAPLEKIWLVLKHKSAAYFQIHMVVAGTTNNALWLAYGILSKNWVLIAPNSLFLIFGTTTLVLYVIYNPKSHPLILDDGDANKAEMSVSIAITPTCAEAKGAGLQSPSFDAMQSPVQAHKN